MLAKKVRDYLYLSDSVITYTANVQWGAVIMGNIEFNIECDSEEFETIFRIIFCDYI